MAWVSLAHLAICILMLVKAQMHREKELAKEYVLATVEDTKPVYLHPKHGTNKINSVRALQNGKLRQESHALDDRFESQLTDFFEGKRGIVYVQEIIRDPRASLTTHVLLS